MFTVNLITYITVLYCCIDTTYKYLHYNVKHIFKYCLFEWASIIFLTAWTKVLIDKLIVTHLVKNFSAFCGIRMFDTVFTRARH